MHAKVTIGMCIKNCEQTIKKAIDSVIKQDYPNRLIEIIVVDGNSDDKTISVVKKNISNLKIFVKIFSDNGKGLGFARQIVVDNSDSKYILWVDGDIILTKNYLQKQVKYMEENPKVGAAQGQWKFHKRRSLAAALDNISSLISFIIFFNRSKKSYLKSLGTVGGIYRVKAIKEVGGFDKSIKGAGEDRDLTARMKKVGWLLSISEPKIFHIYKETWRDLWSKYRWWGYGDYYLYRKHEDLILLWQKNPIVTFLTGINRSIYAYKIVYDKKSFLLPFHNYFRSLAWLYGFFEGFIDKYSHVIEFKLDSNIRK